MTIILRGDCHNVESHLKCNFSS